MKVDAFSYPQEDLLKELQKSRIKVRIMESTLTDFFEELNFVHKQSLQLKDTRGEIVSGALADLLEELRFTSRQLSTLQGNLDDAIQSAFTKDEGHRLRELLVQLMTCSLQHWEETTGTTKIELAEQSGIWKVHLDKGYFRLRTFDRYLSVPSVPQKPRWKDVTRTARFVLACGESSVSDNLRITLKEFQKHLLQLTA
ncbi:MAG: hypothetical protein QMC48_03365 [SAR324 cluster bacterium]|jgi:hypothetical protein|tara:strand:- start:282 stop:875 length:594 start_codon:yes stop_codon:yes gene_type:complete